MRLFAYKDMLEVAINSPVEDLPISVGDVIIKDVFGANIVAAANRK